MQVKCKYCGVDLYVEDNESTIICDVCGFEQTVLHTNDTHILELSSEANRYRLQSRFDEAINLYKHLIEEYPTDCELKWCLLLCEYGITYVDDKKTERKIPTCNRTIKESIFDNENYQYIMEHASHEEKEIYESEAKMIDDIQKNILNLAEKKESYDIFICYKETDENNHRTKDSQYASLVYEQLRALGYKVFFAKETLKNKVGQEYEPIIYAALRSAQIMLVFGTKKEYMESAWVRNEWSRFLAFKQEDNHKNIAACIGFDNAYDIPEELQSFQCVHLNELDYMATLIRSINSFFGHKTEVKVKPEIKNETPEEKKDTVVEEINAIKMAIVFGNYLDAETRCKHLIMHDFKNKTLWDLLVEAQLKGKTSYNEKAYLAFKQLLKICKDPEDKNKYMNKYRYLLKTGDYEEFKEINKMATVAKPIEKVSPVNIVQPTSIVKPVEPIKVDSNRQEEIETTPRRSLESHRNINLFQENKTTSLSCENLFDRGEEHYQKQEYFKAIDLYKRAGKFNYTKAIVRVADCYYYGNGVLQNYKKAFDLYYEMAIRGNSEAQNKLALCYDEGIETKKDPEKAYKYYLKAAEQGHMDAQRNLAFCYKLGKGVKQDLKEALKWLHASAKQGDSYSQNSLGYCFENGVLVKKDYVMALKWYAQAAKQSNLEAECNLARLYCTGKENAIPQNLEKAAYWFMKASDKGHPMSQYYLALLYKKGKIGGKVDNEKAFDLLKKSAMQGYAVAQYGLGLLYEKGDGTELDLDSAYYWYHKASIQNHPNAIKALIRLESEAKKS